MSKYEFGQQKIAYLGQTFSHARIAPFEKPVIDYLKKLKLPKSVKALHWYLRFVTFHRSYIP